MDTIKTYLDNVFTSFPQTERVLALKREMLDSMEEKYRDLKQEGMSEHEAIGSVISNFGSIDEIAEELGIKHNSADPYESISVSREDAAAYMDQTKKSSIWIGIGVCMIMAGVAALLVINGIDGVSQWNTSISAGSIVAMAIAIAAAVVVFIVSGINLHRFEAYVSYPLRLNIQTRSELERQKARFITRYAIQIALGVSVIVLVAGAITLLFLFDWMSSQNLTFALLIFLIGPALLDIINAGMTKSAYDCLLGKGYYMHKVANKKTDKIVGTVASVYWPSMVAAYLLWSLLSGSWHISWIIWPIAGVLFGAFSGGISTWQGAKE